MTDQHMIALNVGGVRFCTSRATLQSIPGTFFTSLTSERIPSARDETGAIFIDRDPTLFSIILNYLRTKKLDLRGQSLSSLRTEAEFFSIQPLVRMLQLVEETSGSSCGDILFHAYLPSPSFDAIEGDVAVSNVWDNNMARLLATPSRVSVDSDPVYRIVGHQNWLAVAYTHHVCCYKRKESFGWELAFVSPLLQRPAQQIAFNSKVSIGSQVKRLLAVATGGSIRVWDITATDAAAAEVTQHDFASTVDSLLFIGTQLVALSSVGKVAVWNIMTHHWKVQQVTPITSHDTAGSSLLLGCANGKIYYIDMEKFPLRMKDNDLLVTQLYQDPAKEAVTALSVYFTPKMCTSGRWLEIAYGTASGTIRVIVEHPETLGQGFQLLHTFTVHRTPVVRVMLGEKHLISVCSDCNHVRTWTVTRFRGCLSTQPGSQPLASFNVMSLEGAIGNDGQSPSSSARDIGPFGDHDDQQVFLQSVVPESNELYVRLSSTGKRLCVLRPVDNSNITAHCVNEFDGGSRIGSRSRRYVVTGQSNGSIQMYDLTTAVEHGLGMQSSSGEMVAFDVSGGPNQSEFLASLEQLELRTTASLMSSRATSERSLTSGQRFHHTSSPSPQCVHHGLSYHGLRGSGRSTHGASALGQSVQSETSRHVAQTASNRSSQVEPDQATNSEADQGGAPRTSSPTLGSQRLSQSQSSALSDRGRHVLGSSQSQSTLLSGGGGVSSASSEASMSASRAAIMHETPYSSSHAIHGASQPTSSIALSTSLGGAPLGQDNSPTSHTPPASMSLATSVASNSHRRSMSMSNAAGTKRSPPSQTSSSNVRHSLSAGEVSAPITRSSVVNDIVSSSLTSTSTAPRVVAAASHHPQGSAQSHLARFGSLPTASSLDERTSYISHC